MRLPGQDDWDPALDWEPSYFERIKPYKEWLDGLRRALADKGYDTPQETSMFLTGSRAYGTPDNNSDYDYVVYVTDELTMKHLESFQEEGKFKHIINEVNFIVCRTLEEYQYWHLARAMCLAAGFPLSREQSRVVHDYVALKVGTPYNSIYDK